MAPSVPGIGNSRGIDGDEIVRFVGTAQEQAKQAAKRSVHKLYTPADAPCIAMQCTVSTC